ncbi:MAG: DUF1573 domain-containing protein [Bacteroidales bacterium]
MKKICLTLVMTVALTFIYAQPQIQFKETTYDFGTIREEGGKVTGRFEFTNVGDSALILKSVRPGCGCTAANYTKTPIEPGEKGFIDATYDPYNRPGNFSKNIKVTTNEPKYNEPSATAQLLFIKGIVAKRPPTQFEIKGYANGNGMVRIKESAVKGELKNSTFRLDTFLICNFWTKNVSFQLQNTPAYITEVYRSFGNEIKPNEEGFIVLKYDGTQRNAYGVTSDAITYMTNDSLDEKKIIFYNMMLLEDFSKLSPKQLKNAPIASLDTTFIDFGKIAKNTPVSKAIIIKNIGKSPLIIRQINSSSSYLTTKMEKMTIEPNSSSELLLTLNLKRKGRQNISVDLFTNDPKHSHFIIETKGEILP